MDHESYTFIVYSLQEKKFLKVFLCYKYDVLRNYCTNSVTLIKNFVYDILISSVLLMALSYIKQLTCNCYIIVLLTYMHYIFTDIL